MNDPARIGCPLAVRLLLKFYCGISDTIEASPAGRDEIQRLEGLGAIIKQPIYTTLGEGHTYITTPLGNAWIASILNVRIPEIAYIDEHGNKIESL